MGIKFFIRNSAVDIFFIEYRDPIFGLFILLSIIFIVAFASYIWGIFVSKKEKKRLQSFVDKFKNKTGLSKEHERMLLEFDVSIHTLALLALAFGKSGDFDKSTAIYLIALQKVKNQKEKEFILSELGLTYFKAGFLARSIEVFMQALSLRTRNETALKYLVLAFEKLKRFKEAKGALVALDELGVDVKAQIAYISALEILATNANEPAKLKQALEFATHFKPIKRLVLNAYLSKGWALEPDFDYPEVGEVLDILYYSQSQIAKSQSDYGQFYKALAGDSQAGDKFGLEISALSRLRKAGFSQAGLSFSYICPHCKARAPMHFYRCPSCYELGVAKIIPHLTEQNSENSMPF